MAHVALGWLLSKAGGLKPDRRCHEPHHVQNATTALDPQLTEEEITLLEQPYTALDNY